MRFQHYYAPQSLPDCSSLLEECGDAGRLLAGGTDVIPRLRSRAWHTNALIDVTNIPDLSGFVSENDGLFIGAAERLRAIQIASTKLPGPFHVLRLGAGHVSSIQVRNAATIGGNLCNASPSADTVPPLVVLGAKIRIYGKNGRRDLPVEQFLLGPGKTALSNDELFVGVCLPAPPCKTGTFYHKYSIRGDSDIAIVGVAASLTLSGDGTIAAAKLALGAVAPTVFRAIEAEKILVGERFCKELVLEAAEVVRKSCSPITDQRATADYRREMAAVWTRHALFDAFEQIEP